MGGGGGEGEEEDSNQFFDRDIDIHSLLIEKILISFSDASFYFFLSIFSTT